MIPPTSTVRKYRYRLQKPDLGLEEVAEVEFCFEGPGLVHHHPSWQILVQLEGQMRVRTSSLDLLLTQDHFCVIRPGVRHSVQAASTGPRGKYVDLRVAIDQSGPLADYVERLGSADLKIWRSPSGTVSAMAGDLRQVMLRGTPADTAELLGPVWCLLRRSSQDQPESQMSSPSTADARVLSTLTLMHDLLGADLPISEMAERVHLSTSQLNRLFHQEIGMGPAAYLRGLRLERARQLLRASTLSIKQISQQCGFQNPQAFARAFRRQFDESPSRYRRTPS